MITDECINCGACVPVCPNSAISQGDEIFEIAADKCSECVGFHDEMACAAVCPVDCCVPDPERVETEEALLARPARCTRTRPSRRWRSCRPACSRYRKK
jgi:ferredoxin